MRRWLFAAATVLLIAAVFAFVLRVRSGGEPPLAEDFPALAAPARLTVVSPSGAGDTDGDSPDESPQGELVSAALAGDADGVRELLAQGVSPSARSGDMTALHRASQAGALEVVDVLLAAGADLEAVSRSGQTALARAAFFGQPAAVDRLLEAGADPNAHAPPNNMTPLTALVFGWSIAVSGQVPTGMELRLNEGARLRIARALIEGGADPTLAPGLFSATTLSGSIGSDELTELLAGAVPSTERH